MSIEVLNIHIDLTPFIGPDGRLSAEGRAKARAALIERMVASNPKAPLAAIEKTAGALFDDIGDDVPAVYLAPLLQLKAMQRFLKKCNDDLHEFPNALITLAQSIDETPGSGVLVYTFGQVNQSLIDALFSLHNALKHTRDLIHSMTDREHECDECKAKAEKTPLN